MNFDNVGSTKIETASGQFVDLAKPDYFTIRIDDIAYGLANTTRFGGQTTRNGYSVAQHSLLVLKIVREVFPQLANNYVQLRALFHDSHEAYMGDDIRPKKMLMDLTQPLKRLSQRLDAAIYRAICLDVRIAPGAITELLNSDALDAIKIADMWACLYERNYLHRSGGMAVIDTIKGEAGKTPCGQWLVNEIKRDVFSVMNFNVAYGTFVGEYVKIKRALVEQKQSREYK